FEASLGRTLNTMLFGLGSWLVSLAYFEAGRSDTVAQPHAEEACLEFVEDLSCVHWGPALVESGVPSFDRGQRIQQEQNPETSPSRARNGLRRRYWAVSNSGR